MADLMRYLPDYYGDVREFIYLTDAENPEIDQLWDSVRKVRNNQFITTSDENRIRQWEKILRIRPDPATQSLDCRKAIVLMRLSTRRPLTYRWLEEKLQHTVGEGNYIIDLRHDEYFLTVRIATEAMELLKELRKYLRQKIPANLGLLAGLFDYRYFSNEIFIGSALSMDAQYMTIKPETLDSMRFTNPLYAGAFVASDHSTVSIPSWSAEPVTIHQSTHIGTAMAGICSLTIPTAALKEGEPFE